MAKFRKSSSTGRSIQVGFDLEGFEELNKTIQKAIIESPKATEKMIHNVGEKDGKARAVEYAPKPSGGAYGPNPYATGYLKDHIEGIPGSLSYTIKSTAAYSGYINSGTRYMAAQPFFTDMWDGLTENIQPKMEEVAEGLWR